MKCRACDGILGHTVVDLGERAIVKFKDSPEEKDDYAWLLLLQCEKCKIVQLAHTVDKSRLYEQFHYLSGVNQSMRDALLDVVKDVEKYIKLEPRDIVVDIGSNDGTLLSCYRKYVWTVGFEPAKNIIPTIMPNDLIRDYFTAQGFSHYGEKAKVVTAIAMFYDVEDPNSFLKDVHSILQEDGIFVIQMNDLDSMCQNISVDNICHEHLFYYNMDTLLPLLRNNRLYPIDVSYNGINGGSIRVICKKTPNDLDFRNHKDPLNTPSHMWGAFLTEKKRLLRYVDKLAREQLWAYGASTRGTNLLQLLGEDLYKKIEFIADRNPKKHGKYMAGTNIPITSEEKMREAQPDNLLVLPYYFEKEFLEREIDYLKKGGRMIFPLPKFRIYTWDNGLKVHGLKTSMT